jgi:hypothetical protein
MEHVPADLLRAREPEHDERYVDYLDSFGLIGRGFVYDELVRHSSHRHTDPPRAHWSRLDRRVELVQAVGLAALDLLPGENHLAGDGGGGDCAWCQIDAERWEREGDGAP